MKKKFVIRFPNGETLEDGIIVDQEDALEAFRCLNYILNNLPSLHQPLITVLI